MDKIQIAFQNGDYCHYEKDKIKLFSGYFRALFASKMADSSKDRSENQNKNRSFSINNFLVYYI